MTQKAKRWIIDGQCIFMLYYQVLGKHKVLSKRICNANLEDHVPLYLAHILGVDTTPTIDPDLISNTMRLLGVSADTAESIAMSMGLKLGHHIESIVGRRITHNLHSIHYGEDGVLYVEELGAGYNDDFKLIQELLESELKVHSTASAAAQRAYVRACVLNYTNNIHMY